MVIDAKIVNLPLVLNLLFLVYRSGLGGGELKP